MGADGGASLSQLAARFFPLFQIIKEKTEEEKITSSLSHQTRKPTRQLPLYGVGVKPAPPESAEAADAPGRSEGAAAGVAGTSRARDPRGFPGGRRGAGILARARRERGLQRTGRRGRGRKFTAAGTGGLLSDGGGGWARTGQDGGTRK